MRLQLAVYDEDDLMSADWSRWATALLAVWGRNGAESLSADVWADLWDVARFQRDRRLYRVKLNYGMWPVWEGRLEDLAASHSGGSGQAGSDGGFRAAALGYWRALRDVPYTALWSWQGYSGYYRVTDDDLAAAVPGKFVIDNNNRVFIAPVSGETFASGGSTDVGAMAFWAPHNGERKIKKVTFAYSVDLPTNWKAQVVSYDEGFASANVEHTVTTSGSGTVTVTLGTDKDGFVFRVFNDGLPGTYSGETEAKFAKWTAVRVWTTDSAAVYGDEIVRALVSFVSGINAGQLSSITTLIESPGVDLTDELYEDDWPADIAVDLAGRGSSASPPVTYEVGVGRERIVYFRPEGSLARRWSVDVADLVLERSLEPVANSIYAVYEDGRGRVLRTAVSANATSVATYGLTRRKPVQARTTSASQAGVARDAELARTAFPAPRLNQLTLLRISTREGLEVWPWEPVSGDTVEIRNLPPVLALGGGGQNVAEFTIDRLTYDPFVGRFGRLSIETRSLAPTVETYLVGLMRGRVANSLASRVAAGVL